MSDTRSTWLWTCGIGCGLLVLVVVAGGVGSFLFLRNTVAGFGEAVLAREELDDRFGRVEEYVPPAAGVISPERVQVFLRVRQDTMERRQAVADFFARIPDPNEADQLENAPLMEKLRFGLSMARGGLNLGADMGHFFEERNLALLSRGMGLGEYSYIYCTIYYGWLRKNPMDGPGTGNSRVSVDGFTAERIRDNWISALQRAAEEAGGAEESELGARLREELERLDEDHRRIPWQDGIPETIAQPLEPFRTELESLYIPVANPFELVINARQGRFGFRSE